MDHLREPEIYLDAVVERIAALADLGADKAAAGITVKDNTTLERLRQRGLNRIGSLDARGDLGATDANADIESVQALLTRQSNAAVRSIC